MAQPATTAGRAAATALFGTLARTFGTRPLHPAGAAFAAELVVGEPRLRAARVFARRGRRRALVRFSRGFGLPEGMPDLISMAVKLPDAYGPGRDQDLLMTATGERPVLRHVFAFGGTHLDRTYSSVLPFRVGARAMVLGAVPAAGPGAERAYDGTLDGLHAAAAAGDLAFDLRVATPSGPWRTVARLEVGAPLTGPEEEQLAFNSSNAGGGIAPIGLVNRVRDAAYDAAARNRR